MINELYSLSTAMEKSGIRSQSWHRKYKPIPNIKVDSPCVRIVVSGGKVIGLFAVKQELGMCLRKFGTNQGSYPCLNLAPLYRITDNEVKKWKEKLKPEDLTLDEIERIRGWCLENNWGKKFQNKYKTSMEKTAEELETLVSEYTPLQVLLNETDFFKNSEHLHQELERVIFKMLDNKDNISLALHILFYFGKSGKNASDDYGSLSVAFESSALIDMGTPAVSEKFTSELNEALLRATSSEEEVQSGAVDAFGFSFEPLEEPMPEVKLAGGFDVKLRTMFKEQRCQTRYGRIENASYPISPQVRKNLHAALSWLGSAEHKNVTWINIEKNEILFAYPLRLPDQKISYTRMFRQSKNRDKVFEEQAKQFLSELYQGRKPGTDSHADRIQLFIVRKIDKGRTKIIYTRLTDPCELERRSEEWTLGCTENIPVFSFGQPFVPFPLDTADILNRFWNQNGELITDKFKPVPKYHGMELLMESELPVDTDMYMLSEKVIMTGAFLGTRLASNDVKHPIWGKVKDMLALMGLFLYRKGIGKDSYMKNLPYLYGQLLKATDGLHALYCKVERKGDFPPRLAGGDLFQAATEAPLRTFHLLSQRIRPYYTWAGTYREKSIEEKGKESWRAGWLYSMCEIIMTELEKKWTPQTRFNDEEKAQLFIGYLAAFPKKEKTEHKSDKDREEQ